MDPEVKDEGFDIEAGVADIAGSLGLDVPAADDPIVDDDPAVDPAAAVAKPVEAPVVRAVPKSWAKDKHEAWSKIDPSAQEYIELREKQMLDGLEGYKADSGLGKQMREIFTPYRALLASQGIEEGKAASVLLNAHFKLSTLPQSERNNYFASLAQTYGVDLTQAQVPQQQQVDPTVKALQEQVAKLTSSMTDGQKRAYDAHHKEVSASVDSFITAKDDKGVLLHPYFDEVGDDILTQINAGATLADAYEKAVWSNPVTRAKENARLQTEADSKLREKRKQEAQTAVKASRSTVRSRDTSRAPTEFVGKMEDTMKETLADIKARPH